MSWHPFYGSGHHIVTIGPGDFNPPDDEPDEEPETETVYKFDGFHIVAGVVVERVTCVEVFKETHEITPRGYGHKWNRSISPVEHTRVRNYAAQHPRKGPKLLAALAAMEAK